MRPLLIILVVGATPELVSPHTPNLQRLAQRGGMRPLETVTPAVTCSVQATLLTGLAPAGHGAVANGWYFRDLAEIWFWRQSNRLIAGEKLWEAAKARDPACTCAKLFWWHNMYSTADWSVTPRPMYPADGRKIPDCYAQPAELRDELTKLLRPFPLFRFWGPLADVSSSRWIAKATKHVMATKAARHDADRSQMSAHKGARLMFHALPKARTLIADEIYTARATKSRTSSPNSRTGGVSPPATTVAHTPSSRRSASPQPSPASSINQS